MICNSCGKTLEDGSVFCGFCGAKLTVPDTAPDTAPVSGSGGATGFMKAGSVDSQFTPTGDFGSTPRTGSGTSDGPAGKLRMSMDSADAFRPSGETTSSGMLYGSMSAYAPASTDEYKEKGETETLVADAYRNKNTNTIIRYDDRASDGRGPRPSYNKGFNDSYQAHSERRPALVNPNYNKINLENIYRDNPIISADKSFEKKKDREGVKKFWISMMLTIAAILFVCLVVLIIVNL